MRTPPPVPEPATTGPVAGVDDVVDAKAALRARLRAARRDRSPARRAAEFWGAPLHSLVIVGRRLHPLEVAYGRALALSGSRWEHVARDVYGCHE